MVICQRGNGKNPWYRSFTWSQYILGKPLSMKKYKAKFINAYTYSGRLMVFCGAPDSFGYKSSIETCLLDGELDKQNGLK